MPDDNSMYDAAAAIGSACNSPVALSRHVYNSEDQLSPMLSVEDDDMYMESHQTECTNAPTPDAPMLVPAIDEESDESESESDDDGVVQPVPVQEEAPLTPCAADAVEPVHYVLPGRRDNLEYHHCGTVANDDSATEFVEQWFDKPTIDLGIGSVLFVKRDAASMAEAVVYAMVWEYDRLMQSGIADEHEVRQLIINRFHFMSSISIEDVTDIAERFVECDHSTLPAFAANVEKRVDAMIASGGDSQFVTSASVSAAMCDQHSTRRINMLARLANRSFSWYDTLDRMPSVYTTDVEDGSINSPAVIGLRYSNGVYSSINMIQPMTMTECDSSRVERISPRPSFVRSV